MRQVTGCRPWMTSDGTLSGRPGSHGEAAGVQMTPPLVVRVSYAACAAAWTWIGARGPTTWASRARGARRKRRPTSPATVSTALRPDTSIPVAVRANLPAITAGGLRRRTGLEVKVSRPGIHKLWVRTD